MWLDLTPSSFHNVFVERWPGHRWCDSHGATHLCQRFLYLALPQSTSKAACCARSWGHSCFHACMTVCMTLLSDVSIWFLLQDKNWNFPARYQRFKALVMGSPWQEALVLETIWWNSSWQNEPACGMVAWQSLTVNSGKHSQADVCLMKNGALHVDIFRLIWSKGLARNGRETRAKMRETGAKKNVYHLTILILTLMTCHVFLKTIFAHGPNRRHGPKRRPRREVMSLWVACCFSLFLGSSPSHLWVHTRVSFPFYLGSRCAKFCFFSTCSCYVCASRCDCDAFVLDFACLARGFFGWKKSMPDYWCGVVWKLCYGWRLCAWGSLRYEKHTWCWSGYFKFTLSKARLLTCAVMQPMLSVVAVRGGIWHAGHALAREQVSYPAFGERIVLITMGNHRTPDTFFKTPLNEHIFWNRAEKGGTHFCVPMGGSGIYIPIVMVL